MFRSLNDSSCCRGKRLLTCVNNLTILFHSLFNQPMGLLLSKTVHSAEVLQNLPGHYISSLSAFTLYIFHFKNNYVWHFVSYEYFSLRKAALQF